MHRRTAFTTAVAALLAAVAVGSAPVAWAATDRPADHQTNRGWDAGNRGWGSDGGHAPGWGADDD